MKERKKGCICVGMGVCVFWPPRVRKMLLQMGRYIYIYTYNIHMHMHVHTSHEIEMVPKPNSKTYRNSPTDVSTHMGA